jgi:hypothetical protein
MYCEMSITGKDVVHMMYLKMIYMYICSINYIDYVMSHEMCEWLYTVK